MSGYLEGRSRNESTSRCSRQTWTLELLARVVAERLQVTVSVGHLWKVLRKLVKIAVVV